MKFPLVYSSFENGWSSDTKQGPAGSFAYSRHVDFRKSPSQITILPATVKESGSIVTGLVTDMIQLPSGKMVAIDSSGGVYVRTIGGSWSKNSVVLSSTAYGMVYNLQQDTIYVPGLNTLHSITNADSRFAGGVLAVNEGAIAHIQDQASSAGHANTYTTLTTISENTLDKFSITPNIEPLYSVSIWVATRGTGALTLTMHDASSNTLGTATIPAATLRNGAYNEFVFTVPVRMYAKPNPASYHFHITHSGGTASTIGTATSNDFSTVDYLESGNRFVNPTSGFHPVVEFLQYIVIGNDRYAAVWEPISQTAPSITEFNQHRLTFPSGYSVTSVALYSTYVAFACEKRSTSATNEFQDGKVFFWDGTSTTYNFFIDVPEGSPYGIQAHKNRLYWFANGGWWAWSGGNPVKVFQMPNTDFEFSSTNTYMVNYPHTMAVRNGILLGAFPSETNSTTIQHGVYSFGQRDKNYPESFGLSYDMSTGSTTNANSTIRQGMIKNFGDKFFLSWRDGSDFGVDKVDPSSPPFATASWESLIADTQIISAKRRFSRPDVDKQSTYMTVVFDALPVGATVTPKYKINREANWEYGTPVAATTGGTEVKLNINERYKEAQIGLDLTATSTTPAVRTIVLITDSLGSEQD